MHHIRPDVLHWGEYLTTVKSQPRPHGLLNMSHFTSLISESYNHPIVHRLLQSPVLISRIGLFAVCTGGHWPSMREHLRGISLILCDPLFSYAWFSYNNYVDSTTTTIGEPGNSWGKLELGWKLISSPTHMVYEQQGTTKNKLKVDRVVGSIGVTSPSQDWWDLISTTWFMWLTQIPNYK